MIEDAIRQFEIAALDPRTRLESCSMLGICFMEIGMPAMAVSWLTNGIETAAQRGEPRLGLFYDLGMAYWQCGHLAKALKAFRQVFAVNTHYRQVAEIIAELQALAGRIEPGEMIIRCTQEEEDGRRRAHVEHGRPRSGEGSDHPI